LLQGGNFSFLCGEVWLLEEIHYHPLRDTYCTWPADKNVPIHVIKAMAGHSSVRVTEGYLSTNTEAMKSEVAKIKLPGKTPSGENEKP
jgi:integrase